MNNIPKEKLFDIACAATGKDINFFAKKHGVSYQAVDRVLKGQSKSQKIQDDIDLFINESLKKLRIILNKAA